MVEWYTWELAMWEELKKCLPVFVGFSKGIAKLSRELYVWTLTRVILKIIIKWEALEIKEFLFIYYEVLGKQPIEHLEEELL